MARVTTEDCVKYVPNRFELAVLAAHRTRQISAGAPLLVERDNDKNHVVALREIASGRISPENLRESLTKSFLKYREMDATERAMAEMLAGEQETLPEGFERVSATEREIQAMVEQSGQTEDAEEDSKEGSSLGGSDEGD